MRRAVGVAGLLLACAWAVASVAEPARAASFGSKVVRGAAIGLAVKTAAKPLNQFINAITLRHGKQTHLATKVVPILSVGEKGFVGGAQVAGPRAQVDRVQAVYQYEHALSHQNYRAKVLLPSASINPLELKRVEKVGVSAIIDVALDGRYRPNTVGTGIQTGDIIRGAAVLAAVKVGGEPINRAINAVTLNRSEATKVVPMGSFGEKAYLGGAQVSGSALTVNTVKALWQYEDLYGGGKFRVKVLVPTSAINPLEARRVDGAGVTAVVDMALSEQEPSEARRERNRRNDVLGDFFGRRDDDDDDDRNRDRRHDNGRHRGWRIGKHKGWENQKRRDD
ncbi:MAG: hypothetical protein HY321_10285 [Armatimonadetes bacterium]|nr:hypothetical protein [Armatimonadota bacterium]